MKKMEMIIIVVLVVYNVKLIRTIKLDFSIVICMHTCTCTQLYILFIVLYAMDLDHVSCLCFYFHEACIFVSRWVLCIFLHHFFIKTYFMYFISYWCDWCYFTLREKFIFCAAENSCKINGYYKFRNFFNLAALLLKLAFKQSWLKFAFLNCKRVINVGVNIIKKINSLIIWL